MTCIRGIAYGPLVRLLASSHGSEEWAPVVQGGSVRVVVGLYWCCSGLYEDAELGAHTGAI